MLLQTADDPERASADLRDTAAFAAGRGLRIGFAALAPSAGIAKVEAAWDVVRRVDAPSLGLSPSLWHGQRPRGSGADRSGADRACSSHRWPRTRIDRRLLTLSFRLFPGQGNLPVAEFCSWLRTLGYKGPMST